MGKLICVPDLGTKSSFKDYLESIEANMFVWFFERSCYTSLHEFIANKDHGAKHTFEVWKRALEIVSMISESVNTYIDRETIYIMSLAHDAGRFRLPTVDPLDKRYSHHIKRQDIAERNHARYAVAQLRFVLRNLGMTKIDKKERDLYMIDEIIHYLINHDKMTSWLDPHLEVPNSLEGQIVLLADRISTNPADEIQRYWDTGKRRGTMFFDPNISLQERIDFNFTKVGQYIKQGKLDQFMFFFAMLAISENDFEHPQLKVIYANWAKDKYKLCTEKIYALARDESYSEDLIIRMKQHIDGYLNHYNVKFGFVVKKEIFIKGRYVLYRLFL